MPSSGSTTSFIASNTSSSEGIARTALPAVGVSRTVGTVGEVDAEMSLLVAVVMSVVTSVTAPPVAG